MRPGQKKRLELPGRDRLEQGPPFQCRHLHDLDGGTQHLTSSLQMANSALNRTRGPSGMSTLAQVDRLKAHHRRADPVTVQVRTRMRYGLVIPHLIQKGAD